MALTDSTDVTHAPAIERISGDEILLRCSCGVVDTYWASSEREETVVIDLHLMALL